MGWVARGVAGAALLHAGLADIYRRRSGLYVSFVLHLGCWIGSAVEIWLALRIARAPLSFGAVLVIESLLHAIRSAAFLVPQAVGVQEGAYILIGAGFGLSPEMALALSLLKRARDSGDRAAGNRRLAGDRRPPAGAPPRAGKSGRTAPSARPPPAD